jgi:precorrin-6B methylase 2
MSRPTMTADLASRVLDPGFTPGKAHLDELFDMLAGQDERLVEATEKALLRFGPELGELLLARMPAATPPLRGRLGRVLGRLATAPGGEALHPALFALLSDPDAKTRRNAIIALGRGEVPGAEEALISLWKPDTLVEHLRSIAASLGKMGGQASLDLLRGVEAEDAELKRIVAQSALMLARTIERPDSSASTIDLTAAAGRPLPVVIRCRRGLEGILLDELEGVVTGAREAGPGALKASLDGPLSALLAARVMLSFSFPLPWVPIRDNDVAGALAEALTSPEAKLIFATFTQGPIRYRLDWQEGGHQRGLVWMCARRVEQADPSLRNDPTRSAWEVLVSAREGNLRVELAPKGYDDPRFAYRERDVPAASHPSIAAALVRVAGVREDDVVWDPFVGSGLELCERARLGQYREMYGTDIEPGAIAAAEANLRQAQITGVSLVRGDARLQNIAGLSLVITNPPMGRRVARHEGVEALLTEMVAHVARQLVPGGRLVWLSPFPDATAEAGTRAGLSVRRGAEVDMGGFWTELQIMTAARALQGELPPPRPGRQREDRFRAPRDGAPAQEERGAPREERRPPREDRRPAAQAVEPAPRDDRRPPPRDDRRPAPRDDRRPPPRDDRRPPPRDDRRPPPRDDRRPPPREDQPSPVGEASRGPRTWPRDPRPAPGRAAQRPAGRDDRGPARHEERPAPRRDNAPPARREEGTPAARSWPRTPAHRDDARPAPRGDARQPHRDDARQPPRGDARPAPREERAVPAGSRPARPWPPEPRAEPRDERPAPAEARRPRDERPAAPAAAAPAAPRRAWPRDEPESPAPEAEAAPRPAPRGGSRGPGPGRRRLQARGRAPGQHTLLAGRSDGRRKHTARKAQRWPKEAPRVRARRRAARSGTRCPGRPCSRPRRRRPWPRPGA